MGGDFREWYHRETFVGDAFLNIAAFRIGGVAEEDVDRGDAFAFLPGDDFLGAGFGGGPLGDVGEREGGERFGG